MKELRKAKAILKCELKTAFYVREAQYKYIDADIIKQYLYDIDYKILDICRNELSVQYTAVSSRGVKWLVIEMTEKRHHHRWEALVDSFINRIINIIAEDESITTDSADVEIIL